MKNQQTLGLILGTTCLATIAMTQVGRPGDAPARDRQTPVAGQGNADSLLEVQQRLQRAVTTEMRASAMKHHVVLDERSIMISLLGDRGMIAGAPVTRATGLDAERKPNEPSGTTGSGLDQDRRVADSAAGDQAVLGVVFLSRDLAPSGDTGQGAAGRTPGANSGQGDAAGSEDPKNRGGAAAGQGGATQDAAGSSELIAFEVRRSQRGQSIELVDHGGQVAMQVQLLGATDAAGRTREASAPREGREDGTVGGNDPLGDPRRQDPQGKEPQGQGSPRTVAPTPSDVTGTDVGSAEWSVVYASVVNQLCAKHHGKQ